ncbi:hypothetical protein ACIX9V_000069 [Vibrio vulnificus]|uniref:hypothetical protein n=1 Tax=Vibrio vulnificus TaxID=672 RepID=UPI0010295884|nr:hypothetical protein [Vibrio vulnificus]ELX4136216.1 hypothetical protein [Vibrio vulnificus]ELX4140283.1 hypothetical protein [Vibrio vulnificus]MCU8207702.1 hypothetical protein [Vibrio vulnificus]MCU8219761.1 hypothetical protein [Vibrio vulnificus]MCU8443373.1 hypothetical protein [Vibrio vulnificus]
MNKKRIIAPTTWSLLSSLHGQSSASDKFIGQVQSGAVMVSVASSIPDNDIDHYIFRSASSGGAGDEFFEAGDGALSVYIRAHGGVVASVVVEVSEL